MEKITIDLYEEGKLRAILLKLNKEQRKANMPEFTLEQFVSMLLATPEFINMLDILSDLDMDAITKTKTPPKKKSNN